MGRLVIVVLLLSVVASLAEDAAPTGRRSLRDWSKMSTKDWELLEDTWMDEEEEEPLDEGFKWRRGPNGARMPPEPKGPKMEMGFATLQPGTKKKACEEIAAKWAALLSTAAVPVKAYSIEDDKILLGVEGGFMDMFQVKEFALDQPETIEFEWQQQKFRPKKNGAPLSAEEKASAKRAEAEMEIRRKLEAGELRPPSSPEEAAAHNKNNNKAKAKAKTPPAKAAGKGKAKDAPKKEKQKVKAEKKKKDEL